MESGHIGGYGERAVEAGLVADGWVCRRNTQLPGSTDIEAGKDGRRILVQVKTGMIPNAPPAMSGDEVRNIKSRATKLAREPWLAKVQINSLGQRVGPIRWEYLG